MAQSASYKAHLSAALTTALLAAAVGLGSHTALATPSCNDSDPYLICNVQDLQNVNNDLAGSYVLGQDLDASGFNFTPIGRVDYNAFLPFTGSLNGNGHTINHLSISSQSDLYVGMFVYVDEVGRVENLTLSDVAIQGTSPESAVEGGTQIIGSIAAESHGSIIKSSTTGTVSGGAYSVVAGLVGYQGYPGRVVQSSSSATVIGGKTNMVGGLVGQNFGDIVASYATGDVYAQEDSWVGGLAGYHSDASISRSYSTANVQGGPDSYIGGLVGWNLTNSNIDRSYALGSVTGSNSSYIGGLVGENGGVCPACAPAVIDQSYSAGPVADPLGQHVGGLVGLNYPSGSVFNQGIVTSSYWDTQTSGQSTSDGGNPKTTAELKSGTLPTGFDSAVWTVQPGKYPTLTSNPPSLTFADVLAGAVRSEPSGNEMDAFFTPNFGLTLKQAAMLGGFDHFNWIQNIENYPGILCVLSLYHPIRGDLDPPIGGTLCQRADNLPFYWDEGGGADPGYSLNDNINAPGNTLAFSDIPEDIFIIPFSGESMSFVTSLVGVYSDDTWLPLYTFTWMSDYNPIFGGGIARDITPSSSGAGHVFDVHKASNPTDVPPEVLQSWIDNGARITAAPEPGSLALMGTALLLLGIFAWCRLRSGN